MMLISPSVLAILLATTSPVTKLPDGIVVKLGQSKVRLTVFDQDIMRVRTTGIDGSLESRSLAVIGAPTKTSFKVSESAREVVLTTAKLQAHVSKTNGSVRFLDPTGKPIVSETGFKGLKPNTVAGMATSKSEASFTLAKGEAIYGLGQHQIPTLNYRGYNVHLQQENREIAIPMMLSSGGYGVLWDNPAVTDVAVAAGDEGVVPSSMLADADGKPGGLTVEYFKGRNFEQPVGTGRDEAIDFNWTTHAPAGLPLTDYSVRWTGYLVAPKTGEYTLLPAGDDGIRLFLGGKKIAEDWNARAIVTLPTKVHLVAGQRIPLKFEFFQQSNDSVVRLGYRAPSAKEFVKWSSETAEAVDYVFFYGPNLNRVIQGYRQITGQAPLFGRWAWGLWQSRERYQSQQELMDIAGSYRTANIPLDGIIQDWQYWVPGHWGSHDFDLSRYPDPGKLITDLHGDNVHTLISVWPKFDLGSEAWKEIADAGGMLPKVLKYVFPAGEGQWYDPYSTIGRRTYWQGVSKRIAKYGWDGWWLDASEPELSGAWGELRDIKTGMGMGSTVFNAYPLMHTKAVYDGQRGETDKKRVLILTRSGYAGQQRNAAVSWSGDINASWQVLSTQIPAGINFAMSGIPYWNTDTGGFFANEPVTSTNYQDLFERWFQFSTFCPMLRIHGTGTQKEIFRWPAKTRQVLESFDELRYHLLPYIYSTSWDVTHRGGSMMRGLPLDFRTDANTYDITDQYLFGKAIMANPVHEKGQTSRSVYLPKGTSWIDFWTGQRLAGGQTIQSDAVGKLPLFVRSGSILPYGPKVQHAQAKCDPTELRVYTGADGSFQLYDDAGDGYAYEKGAYSTIDLNWNEKTRTLTIGARKGTYPAILSHREFRIVLVRPEKGVGVANSASVDQVVKYTGKKVEVKL